MRDTSTYRAQRRNDARDTGAKFPLNLARAKVIVARDVRPNERDRSEETEERRSRQTIDFTGKVGLARSQINFGSHTIFKKKPKRGWAAKVRRAPFREYFASNPKKLEEARMRHAWYRKQKALEALREMMEAA